MSRTDRLMDLADLLRGRDETTVEDLAGELGVSPRTLHRDLATLRNRGMPITGEPGRGGGIRLEGSRGVTAVHLSIAEVVAMWLAARLSGAASDLPWSDAARSGLAKLLGSLTRTKAGELRLLCRRVIVGPPASEAIRGQAGPPPRELLGRLEEAFSRGMGLGFHYTDRAGRRTVRRIEPHGLMVEPPVWYILARDLDKAEPRTFRMDRIARPQVLPDIRFRPDVAMIEAQLPDARRWRSLTA